MRYGHLGKTGHTRDMGQYSKYLSLCNLNYGISTSVNKDRKVVSSSLFSVNRFSAYYMVLNRKMFLTYAIQSYLNIINITVVAIISLSNPVMTSEKRKKTH